MKGVEAGLNRGEERKEGGGGCYLFSSDSSE